eukprot:3933279-Rhodomonas_salina.2
MPGPDLALSAARPLSPLSQSAGSTPLLPYSRSYPIPSFKRQCFPSLQCHIAIPRRNPISCLRSLLSPCYGGLC